MAYISPEISGLSSLATNINHLRTESLDRSIPVYGIAVHQTGSGIVEQAIKNKMDPFTWAVAYYRKPDSYYAHYVIGYQGEVAQIADEHERAPHIGLTAADRDLYLDGKWTSKVSQTTVSYWRKRWPSYKSPSHLYEGASPNNAYVGMEMLPVTKGSLAVAHPGTTYTTAQHHAVASLALDIATRWNLPRDWFTTGRFATHEDITPMSRQDTGGGWDPGVIRPAPRFNWDFMLWYLKSLKQTTDLLV